MALFSPAPRPLSAVSLSLSPCALCVLFLAAFQECCNAACSYRVGHCVRRPFAKKKKKIKWKCCHNFWPLRRVAVVVARASTFRLRHQSLLMLAVRCSQAPLKRIRNIAAITVNGFHHATVKPRFLITLGYGIKQAKRAAILGII